MTKYITLALAVAVAGAAQATVLTFGDLHEVTGAPLGNYGVIDHAYGDNVTQTNDGVGSYLMGSGWTPNVTTSYATHDGAHNHFSNNLLHWDSSYGDLEHIAFSEVSNGYARLILSADAGWSVRLESFDLAGWPQTDQAIAYLRVLDGANNILWDANTTVAHGAGPTHDHYAPNLVGQTLVIEWGPNWNAGLDNVSFSQTDVVPEPATMAVLGLGALALKRRRR